VRPDAKGVWAGVGHFQLRVLVILEADDVDAVRASRERSGGTHSVIRNMHSVPDDDLNAVKVHDTPEMIIISTLKVKSE
jgi:hypothetical protein